MLRTYAKIAPDASHALHMPSHIFMALGMWDDVIASNKAAWESGLKENKQSNPNAFTIDDFHALQWLSYGYLQKKNYKAAYQLMHLMEKITTASNASMAKWYYALMRAAYIIESGDFATQLKSMDMQNIELSARASDLYVNAIVALKQPAPNIAKAKFLLHQLKEIPQPQQNNNTQINFFTSVTTSGINTAKISALELAAEISWLEGNKSEAEQLLIKAKNIEEKISFGYGPPIPVKPAFERLAELLLEEKKYTLAYKEFVLALQRTPNRYPASQGLEQSRLQLEKANLPVPEGIKPYFNRLMLPDYYH